MKKLLRLFKLVVRAVSRFSRRRQRERMHAKVRELIAARVWELRRQHLYVCGVCKAEVVGLDYCLPMGWSVGFGCADDAHAMRYACSDPCVRTITWEMRP